MDLNFNLADDICGDPLIVAKLKDEQYASNLYSSLCNIVWKKGIPPPSEELVAYILRHGEINNTWSCSWRYAGGLVARIRSTNHNVEETYIDWYCDGMEGIVFPEIKIDLERLGWTYINN